MTDAARAETALLGIVLLFGIVAVGSVGVLVVAEQASTEVTQESENDRVEGAFVELSQEMGATAVRPDVSRSIDLDVGRQGAVTKRDAGWIEVESDGLEEDLNLSIGAIEYAADDGTRIAYQAGGVWRERGNETRMVSAPPIHYDAGSETFTFPVVTVGGDRSLSAGEIAFSHERTTTFEEATVVEDESVTVTVGSEFYRGWEEYFERQAGEAVVRDVDHDNRTVTVRLGYLELSEAFDEGVVVSENFDDFESADVDGGVTEGSMPELDELIDELVADARSGTIEPDEPVESHPRIDGSFGTLENGTYFTEELVVDGPMAADLADGNVTIVVDGDVHATDEFVVENYDRPGTDASAKIYTTGDVEIEGGGLCVENCDSHTNSSQLQVYGTSETRVGLWEGEPSFHGTLYAPSDEDLGSVENDAFGPGATCDEQVCMIANADFYGALVAASANVHSAAVDLTYDRSLEEIEPDVYPEGYELPPKLTYLNVAHHEIDVESR